MDLQSIAKLFFLKNQTGRHLMSVASKNS